MQSATSGNDETIQEKGADVIIQNINQLPKILNKVSVKE